MISAFTRLTANIIIASKTIGVIWIFINFAINRLKNGISQANAKTFFSPGSQPCLKPCQPYQPIVSPVIGRSYTRAYGVANNTLAVRITLAIGKIRLYHIHATTITAPIEKRNCNPYATDVGNPINFANAKNVCIFCHEAEFALSQICVKTGSVL